MKMSHVRNALTLIIVFSIYSGDVFSQSSGWRINSGDEQPSQTYRTLPAQASGASSASSTSPVWRVSDGDNYFYLGGTVHVLSKNDYPLPKAFELAYMSADKLIFETDIQAATMPETHEKMAGILALDESQTLESELSPDVYLQLESFLEDWQVPISFFQKMTPAGVGLTLTMIELQRLGVVEPDGASYGVDEYYSQRALAEGKDIGALETVDEQIAFMHILNDQDNDQLIKSSLRDLAKMDGLWRQMLIAWREGDLERLDEFFVSPMKEFPSLYQVLLIDRNNNWLKKMGPMMETPQIEFILVGAAHMVGEEGLIQQLRNSGYTVEYLN